MEKNYIIWIENGVVSMASVIDVNEAINKTIIENPVTIVTMQYGVTSDGKLTNPQDPNGVKTKFIQDMMPYVLGGFVTNDEYPSHHFTLDTTGKCVSYLPESELPVIEKYKTTVEVFNSAR